MRLLDVVCSQPIDPIALAWLGDVLDRLPRKVPHLQTLCFEFLWRGPIHSESLNTSLLYPTLAASIPQLTQLQTLAISGFSCAHYVFPIVSSLPHLKELTLHYGETEEDVPVFPPGSFPALEVLDISASASMCRNIVLSLELVVPFQIHSLRIFLWGYYTREGQLYPAIELSEAICSLMSETLTKIDIRASGPVNAHILEPLFACSQIESVYMPITFASGKQELEIFADAHLSWPNLRVLDFDLQVLP